MRLRLHGKQISLRLSSQLEDIHPCLVHKISDSFECGSLREVSQYSREGIYWTACVRSLVTDSRSRSRADQGSLGLSELSSVFYL